ncbi:MAG TPA: serine hydrolase domain-containing protein [Nakamurella sp.]
MSLTEAPAAAKVPSIAARPDHTRLQALLDELVINGAPGVLAFVDDGPGPAWRGASGAARLDPRIPLRAAARFRAGSITKSMVATVALQLVGEGKLRLDDTVERWLPGSVPQGDSITLRQLLNHTSGIYNYTDDPAFLGDLVADPTRTRSPESLVAVATSHPPLFQPGSSWSYSNTNYILVGLIIQAATGRAVQTELGRRIFTPLGLHNTSFPVTDRGIAGYHAHGYLLPGNPFIPTDQPLDVTTLVNPSWAWAAGAVISTADDLARFYGALFGGRLLSPALLRQMQTTVQVDPVFGYGLGVFSIRTVCGTIWGHNGGVPGYISFASNSRDGKRHMVLMMSADPDAQTGPLLDLALTTATCDMFGQNITEQARANSAPLLRAADLNTALLH